MNAHRDAGPIAWLYDTADQAYILIDGPCRCRVWKTTPDVWATVIRCHGNATTADAFPTADKTKTWRQARGGALRAGT